jgi:hypothetical protein
MHQRPAQAFPAQTAELPEQEHIELAFVSRQHHGIELCPIHLTATGHDIYELDDDLPPVLLSREIAHLVELILVLLLVETRA